MDINYPAFIAAALSTLVIGRPWYSPMPFQRARSQKRGAGNDVPFSMPGPASGGSIT